MVSGAKRENQEGQALTDTDGAEQRPKLWIGSWYQAQIIVVSDVKTYRGIRRKSSWYQTHGYAKNLGYTRLFRRLNDLTYKVLSLLTL